MAEMTTLLELWRALNQQTDDLLASLDIQKSTLFQSDLDASVFAKQALTDFWFEGEGDGRLTKNYYGHFHVSEKNVEAIQQLNQIKHDFHQCLLTFSTKDRKAIMQDLPLRDTGVNQTLHTQGLSRLHVRQATRQIPVMAQGVQNVVFNWYRSGRSIKKLTKKEVWDRLMALGPENVQIAIQLEQLASHPDHQPLAQVQTQAPVLRANVRYDTGERKALNAPLPLFTCGPLPMVKFPSAEATIEPKKRQARSDQKIASEPWLASVRVHRYL